MYNIKSNPNVNYGPWVIMMCPCRFISCNKSTALVLDVDSGGGCVGGGQGVWELFELAAQLCCEPKTALKHLSLLILKNAKKSL